MRRRLAILAALLAGVPAAARPAPRRLQPPDRFEQLLATNSIAPGATLIASGAASGSRLRTLELDDLAPARLRLTVPF